MAKRRYIRLGDWIICLKGGELVEIDNRWPSNFNPDTGEGDEYYCNAANMKVMRRTTYWTWDWIDRGHFEREVEYVGKLVATGDDLGELRERAECGSHR